MRACSRHHLFIFFLFHSYNCSLYVCVCAFPLSQSRSFIHGYGVSCDSQRVNRSAWLLAIRPLNKITWSCTRAPECVCVLGCQKKCRMSPKKRVELKSVTGSERKEFRLLNSGWMALQFLMQCFPTLGGLNPTRGPLICIQGGWRVLKDPDISFEFERSLYIQTELFIATMKYFLSLSVVPSSFIHWDVDLLQVDVNGEIYFVCGNSYANQHRNRFVQMFRHKY